MQTMAERDARHPLAGNVQVDDAYLGGELPGGKPGRGSENKVPFVAAVSTNAEGHPMYAKMVPVPGFTLKAIGGWAKGCLSPSCVLVSDGLACFAAVADADCKHQPVVVGTRKPKDLPQFKWVNTIVGNLKTSLGGAYHAFDFAKYGTLPGCVLLSLQPALPSRYDPLAPTCRRHRHRAASGALAPSG
jgi:hypothetical protein